MDESGSDKPFGDVNAEGKQEGDQHSDTAAGGFGLPAPEPDPYRFDHIWETNDQNRSHNPYDGAGSREDGNPYQRNDYPRQQREDSSQHDEDPSGHNRDPWKNPEGYIPYESYRPYGSQYYQGDLRPALAGPDAVTKPRKRGFAARLLRDVVIPLIIAFIVAMVFQATVAKPYQIPSGSMLPTIQLQDRIIADRLIYHFKSIERGDVVVFEPPAAAQTDGSDTPFVKRVIGLPGDTVEIRNGQVLVNDEPFVVSQAITPTYVMPKETVPDGQLFVLGDNRNESYDSHRWGYVPMDNVIGRAEVIYWPLDHLSKLGL